MNKNIKTQLKVLITYVFSLILKLLRLILNIIKNLYAEAVNRLRFSISFKITLVYTWLFTKLLIFSSIILWIIFSLYIVNIAEQTISKNFNLIKYYMDNSDDIPNKQIQNLTNLTGIKVSLFDNDKKTIFSTDVSHAFYSNRDNVNINNSFFLVFNGSILSQNSFSLILNNNLKIKDTSIYIQLNYNLTSEIADSINLLMIFFCINGFFIFLSIHPGSKASKKLLRPIDKMVETINKINISVLDTRLDISGSKDELKDLAKTFNNMLDRLQNSYELQNQFVSDASHELRTPISVIQGYANLLHRWGKNDPKVLDESIVAIKTEAESMKGLIEDLLFLARSDKNTQQLQCEEFYINELIDEIVKETKLIALHHNIIIETNDSIKLYADKSMVKQALRIFMDNSLKYTKESGTIKINCSKEKNQALISIEDTGIGISKEDLPNIFNRFYRADKSRTKDTGGTGLGLSIAKWIILKHKGFIEVESQLNLGTKFIIKIETVNTN